MKLNKIFLPMAALALVGAMTAGCSSDDLATDTPAPRCSRRYSHDEDHR